jgi:hypothetical protein
MAVQTLGVWNLHASQDQFAALNQSMHIVTDANMNHAGDYSATPPPYQGISPPVARI